jgi:hypothetical protein
VLDDCRCFVPFVRIEWEEWEEVQRTLVVVECSMKPRCVGRSALVEVLQVAFWSQFSWSERGVRARDPSFGCRDIVPACRPKRMIDLRRRSLV